MGREQSIARVGLGYLFNLLMSLLVGRIGRIPPRNSRSADAWGSVGGGPELTMFKAL